MKTLVFILVGRFNCIKELEIYTDIVLNKNDAIPIFNRWIIKYYNHPGMTAQNVKTLLEEDSVEIDDGDIHLEIRPNYVSSVEEDFGSGKTEGHVTIPIPEKNKEGKE